MARKSKEFKPEFSKLQALLILFQSTLMIIASDTDAQPQQVFQPARLTWKQLLEALQKHSGLVQHFCVSGGVFLKSSIVLLEIIINANRVIYGVLPVKVYLHTFYVWVSIVLN